MATAKKKSKPRAERPGRSLRITRVYTRTGDKGTTRLVGGQEVKKNSPRIEAYGTVDELSVWMGHARDALEELIAWVETESEADSAEEGEELDSLLLLDEHLRYIQNLLFTLGGDLATRIEDRWDAMPVIEKAPTDYLEGLIDAYNERLEPLTDFVLPGGGPLPLALHTCRVVCRRAERVIQSLAEEESIGGDVLPFVNRLSDLFFVLARWVVDEQLRRGLGDAETLWDRDLAQPQLPPAAPKKKS